MNIRKFLLPALLAALPVAMFGRPASPEVARYTNPDGSVVEFRTVGDEHFHYYTDAKGEQILEFKDKALLPAMRDGERLYVNESTISRLRLETPDMFPQVESVSAGKVNRMAALDANGRSTYPTLGNVRACVILLEYPDYPFSMDDPQAFFTRLCNEKGYSDYNSKGSAKDYYEACSNGKFSPTFDVYGPVKLSHEAKWYVGDDDPDLAGYLHHARFGYAIEEALKALDATVDFSVYDYDNNGQIDNIFFFYSGRGQADCKEYDAALAPYTVWPHQYDFRNYTTLYPEWRGGKKWPQLDRLYVDGKEMTTYACSNELNSSHKCPSQPWVDGIGAFCHEYGHVLGLPDMYDVSGSRTKTPAYFDVMDTGSYNDLSCRPPLFSAYEKWVCNWLEYTNAANDTEYTLNPITSDEANAVRIRVPKPGNRFYPEYYVLECRADESWDAPLSDHGMLIWRINYTNTVWAENQVNVNGVPNVELITPSKVSELTCFPGEDDLKQDFITASTGELTPANLKGTPLSSVITNITYDGSKVTFEYNKYKENNVTTLLHSTVGSDQENRTLTLSWDAAEGATDYMLTVKRRDSSNREYVVGGLDDTKVGNVTSYTLGNISPLQWFQTFTAKVRVVSGVPSTATSNTISFIPANLEDTGVEEIGAVIGSIYGGKGHIVCPEGSRVYNLSGVETGKENLAPGIYIVVAPKATAKVTVK